MFVAYVTIVSSNARAGDDAVYLHDGSEIRGSLIERIASSEIVFRAGDGSIRRYSMHDVAYVGRHGTGGVQLTTELPGVVDLDGRAIGRAPVQLDNIESGPHQARVKFDAGGFAEQTLIVRAGRLAAVHLAPTISQIASAQRDGAHLVIDAGALIGAIDTHPLRGGAAVGLQAGLNVGLSTTLDLRVLAHVYLGYENSRGSWYDVSLLAGPRLNLGSWYSMEFALRVGVSPKTAYSYPKRLQL